MHWLSLLFALPARLPGLARWDVRRVLLRQIYFSALQALPMILMIGMAVGAIVVSQLHYQIGQSGEGSLRLLASITLSELAPLLTAIALTARSSAAMASELAMMRVSGEIETLRLQGVDPLTYLVLPRVLALALACGLLSCHFALAALLTGAVGVAQMNGLQELARLPGALPIDVLLWCPIKGLVFGAGIAVVACARGLHGRASLNDVPIAASQAVVRSLSGVFVLDVAFIVLGRL